MNDDWKNFEPRRNAPSATAPQADDQAITTKALEVLLNDPDALRTLAKSKLVEILYNTPKPNISLVPAIRELLDRVDGKAPQSVSMTVKTDPVSKLTDDQLAAILAHLPNNPMVIPPMPKKIEQEM